MTRYYVHYVRWCDVPAGPRFFRADVLRALIDRGRAVKVGVCFKLVEGRLVASHLSLPNRSNNIKHLPLTEAEGNLLVPLSIRQDLWEEAIDDLMRAGIRVPGRTPAVHAAPLHDFVDDQDE